jgi:4,5-DOPA dioxygenase extradiol
MNDATSTEPMPVLFIGHGSPMNAIEDNPFAQSWAALGQRLPRPEAILCVSAHWLTEGTAVTAMETPRTIHDFYGFPEQLYQVSYPAPGAPELARQTARLTAELIRGTQVRLDEEWGLDHGAWSVLRRMYPRADVPTCQLSLDVRLSPAERYQLAAQLRPLRDQGILIIGSGNVVHNLRDASPGAVPYDWAVEFDRWVKTQLLAGDHRALIDYRERSPVARMAHPTADHYWPLLYAIALQDEGEPVSFFSEQIVYGSISMRGVVIGQLLTDQREP